MTTKNFMHPLRKHLYQLHTCTQNAEAQTLKVIADTERVEAEAAETATFDLAAFSDSYADLLLTIHELTASNKELKEMLQVSISNKTANAIMVLENLDLLAEVDMRLIAAQIIQVRDRQTMIDAVNEIRRLGGEGAERLTWLVDALRQNGLLRS